MINPHSCAGRAVRVWRTAERIFEKASVELDVIETEAAGHGTLIAREINLKEYRALITVSGDGLIHEVVNGFMTREDDEYKRTPLPIGVLPGGTSDGLGKTVLT